MFKTKVHLSRLVMVVCAGMLAIAASAQSSVPKNSSQQQVTPASIAEITRLSRELRIESLKKELRDAKEERKPETGITAGGLPVPVVAPVREMPRAPAVHVIYGSGNDLRARLTTGQEVQAGAQAGHWRVTSIDAAGVSFERCEKNKRTKKAECEIQYVVPGNS